jgi:hypothetical protein
MSINILVINDIGNNVDENLKLKKKKKGSVQMY